MSALRAPVRWLALLLWLACGQAVAAPLEFGLFPNLPTRQLLALYTPLADALARELGRPVRLLTAPDFATFVERTRDGDYDLVLTAPHLAWLAHRDAGYLPLAKSHAPVTGLLVVRADGPLHAPRDLAGKTMLIPDPLAVVALAMDTELDRAGVHPRRTTGGTHTNAALRVAEGHADAAVIGSLAFTPLPQAVKAQLRVLLRTPSLTGQLLLVHPRLSQAERKRLAAGIRHYARSPAGRDLLRRNGFGGLDTAGPDDLAGLGPYATQAARLMEPRP